MRKSDDGRDNPEDKSIKTMNDGSKPQKNAANTIVDKIQWLGRVLKVGGGGNTGFVKLLIIIAKNANFQHGDLVRLKIDDSMSFES